jgi:hypothetical protein
VAGRAAAIEALCKIVAEDAGTREQVRAKVEAIRLLGQMRAVEAAPDLAAQIAFRDPYVVSREYILEDHFPAVGSLVAIGKPGSTAALEAIEHMGPVAPPEGDPEPQQRLFLLTLVVLRVEGRPVAEFIMKGRLDKAAPEAQAALRRALDQLGKLSS